MNKIFSFFSTLRGIMILVAIVLALGGGAYLVHKIKQGVINDVAIDIADNGLDTKEKQNEAAENRPDADTLADIFDTGAY